MPSFRMRNADGTGDAVSYGSGPDYAQGPALHEDGRRADEGRTGERTQGCDLVFQPPCLTCLTLVGQNLT